MLIQLPTQSLRPFVSHYWLSHFDIGTIHWILPDGCTDTVFEIGRATGARAYGVATHVSSCAVSAGYHYLGICFRPGQIRRFLRLPAALLTNSSMEIKSLAGLQPETLADRIADGSVLQGLDRALISWLEKQSTTLDPVDRALQILDRHNGNVRIETVVAGLNLSRRQIERRFLDAVGMSPKSYAGIRRLQQALTRISAQPTTPLATVALDAGYADQSHMSRSFKRMLGQSPRAAVAFVQDDLFPSDYIARAN